MEEGRTSEFLVEESMRRGGTSPGYHEHSAETRKRLREKNELH